MSGVVREGPGYRVERDDVGLTLVIVGQWGREAQSVVESGLVDGLDLNYAKGFQNPDLDFIDAWPLRRVTLLARTVTDLSPLHRLRATLERVSVQAATSARLDLTQFRRLASVAADWALVWESIGACRNLTELYLGGYRAEDLSPLVSLTGLTSLTLKDRPALRALTGIGELSQLARVGVFGAPLGSLEQIGSLRHLRELQIEACGAVGSLTPVAELTGLRVLNASDCGELESLAPVRGLVGLETLWLFGTTTVADGDLSPVVALPNLQDFRMKSRSFYRPSVREVQSAIGSG